MQPQEELMQEPLEALEELPAKEAGGGGGGGGQRKGSRGRAPKANPSPNPYKFRSKCQCPTQKNPLPVHIQPTPAPHATPETPTTKDIPFTLPALQNLKKLVAIVQTFVTTSNKMATVHTAWHSG